MLSPIDKIIVEGRFRKDLQNLESLMASIESVGLLHPIVVDEAGKLIAGERRLESCKRLGWTEIPVHLVKVEDILEAQRDENTARSDFLLTELVGIYEAIGEKKRGEAKERQKAGISSDGKSGGRGKKKPSGKFPQGIGGRSKDAIAAYGGVSGRTLEKAIAIVKAAETNPEKFGDLPAEMDRTKRVNGVYKKLVVAKQAEKLNAEPLPPPEGPFAVIVIDPPWKYSLRSGDSSHRSSNPYRSMDLEEIQLLPVQKISHENSILWLWTTNNFMREALHLVEFWGFNTKTILTWIKNRIGTGDWLRGQTEHCILAAKGRPTVTLTNQSTALIAPAGKHSEKPDAFYELVKSLCPGSKIDMFSRKERVDFHPWGLEVIPSGSEK